MSASSSTIRISAVRRGAPIAPILHASRFERDRLWGPIDALPGRRDDGIEPASSPPVDFPARRFPGLRRIGILGGDTIGQVHDRINPRAQADLLAGESRRIS